MSHNGRINNTVGNAAPVQLRGSGRVLVPFCLNNSKSMFLTWSDTEGESWAPPIPINSKDAALPSWNWVGLGPPGAIQLRTGRILVPAYHSVHGTYPQDDNGDWSHGHVLLSGALIPSPTSEILRFYNSHDMFVADLPIRPPACTCTALTASR